MVHAHLFAWKTIETWKIGNNHSKCIFARCLLCLYNGELKRKWVCVRSVTLKVIFIRKRFAIWNSYSQSHFLLFIINLSFACFLVFLLSLCTTWAIRFAVCRAAYKIATNNQHTTQNTIIHERCMRPVWFVGNVSAKIQNQKTESEQIRIERNRLRRI